MTNIPYADVGMASLASEDFSQIELFSGTPPTITTPETAGAAIEPFSVVGRISASKKVVLSNPAANDGSEVPIGITTAKALADTDPVAIFRDGMFNPAALVWHAGYDTDEKKRLAFEASPGCNIFIRKRG